MKTSSRMRFKPSQQAMTLIEVMIAAVIIVIATLGLLQAFALSTRLNDEAKEKTIAMEAAREKLEELRAYEFQEIYRVYNYDSYDDPGGPGTGPGPNFEVEGLNVRPGDYDGMAGRIVFPARETVVDAELGMPRDLNGDGFVTDHDISLDYIVLPLSIYVEWSGRQGPREIRLQTLLGERSMPQ